MDQSSSSSTKNNPMEVHDNMKMFGWRLSEVSSLSVGSEPSGVVQMQVVCQQKSPEQAAETSEYERTHSHMKVKRGSACVWIMSWLW